MLKLDEELDRGDRTLMLMVLAFGIMWAAHVVPVSYVDRIDETLPTNSVYNHKLSFLKGNCQAFPTRHKDGETYLLTAKHCIGKNMSLKTDEIFLDVELVEEGSLDWAVIKVDRLLPTVEVSQDRPSAGEVTRIYHSKLKIGAGNIGRVVAKKRKTMRGGEYIATNTTFPAGYSGSPLWVDEKVVGVAVKYKKSEFLALAIPLDLIPDKYLKEPEKEKRKNSGS